jgi:exosortase
VTSLSGNAEGSKRYIELFLLLAASVALWWQAIVSTLQLAFANDAYTHILLILPLSVALMYFERRQRTMPGASGRRVGAIVLAIALVVLGLTAWNLGHLSSDWRLSVGMLALVFWWIGSLILCFGFTVVRTFLFPLCFLFLIVPLPENFIDVATVFLQRQSALASEILFRVAHVPVTRAGIMLSIPALDIEVARECSSIRSSTMLIVITLILAHLFLRSWWRKVLLVVVAIPLSVAKNAVRIFTIAELGTRVDPGYLNGRLHHNGGVIFLGFALVVDVGLLLILRRGESIPEIR